MTPRPSRSIAVRMATALAVVAGTILVLQVLILAITAERVLREERADQHRHVAQHVAAEIEREIAHATGQLGQAAFLLHLNAPAREADAPLARILAAVRASADVAGVAAIGTDGQILAADPAGGPPPAVREALTEADTQIADVRLLRVGEEVLLLYRPEPSDGAGPALAGWVPLVHLLAQERTALADGDETVVLWLGAEADRVVTGRAPPPDAPAGEAAVKGLPLRIVTWSSPAAARAAARRLDQRVALASGTLLGTGLLAMLFVTRRTVLLPLRRLRERVRAASHGSDGPVCTDPGEGAEIRDLAVVFDEMQHHLRDRADALETANGRLREEISERGRIEGELVRHREDLEATVRERTRQLERANQELEAVNRGLENRVRERTAMLLQAEKMASVGQLAAGIAHEINNPAGFVSGNLETLRTYTTGLLELTRAYETLFDRLVAAGHVGRPDIEQIRELAGTINLAFIREDLGDLLGESAEGMDRIGRIVNDLKGFSHVDKEDAVDENDLNGLVEKAVNVAWNELKYKCEVRKDYGDVPPIRCNGGRISQVILNLLVNAAQAIEARGEVRIATSVDDGQAVLTIADTGPGIPPEILSRIFDPFFTTKPVGKGTGLGLHICQKIIDAHRGSIRAENAPDGGAVFRVYLPIAPVKTAGATRTTAAAGHAAAPSPQGRPA